MDVALLIAIYLDNTPHIGLLDELIRYSVDHNEALDDCKPCHGLVNRPHKSQNIASNHSNSTTRRQLKHSKSSSRNSI